MNLKWWIKAKFEQLRSNRLRRNLYIALPFWISSLLTGVAAVLYARLFAAAEHLLVSIFSMGWWVHMLIAPILFVTSFLLVKKLAPAARGSGIPQVMAAIELSNPKQFYLVGRLLSLRILVVKVISSIALLLGGGAIGREGPTIQIAGSVFREVQRLFSIKGNLASRKNTIITGAAAGLAAAFNTPLGGIVFAVEELAKNHLRHFRTALFSAVIIAGFTAQALMGPYLYLGYPAVKDVSPLIIVLVAVVAIVAGLGGATMAKIILGLSSWKRKLNFRQTILFLIACGIAMSAMGSFLSVLCVGSGKELMTKALFESPNEVEWYLPIARMIGPVLSFTSGGAGGVFAPSLSAGAAIGGVMARLMELSGSNANILILSGMVGFLTGITRSPFTSAILVLEMTDRHSVIFHLMLAGMAANLAGNQVDTKSLYDRLKEDYMEEIAAEDVDAKLLEKKN